MAAELLYYLKYTAAMLAIGCVYSVFAAYNIGLISLFDQPRHAVEATITLHDGRCSRGKGGGIKYWESHVQLPEPYSHFNGDWCSKFHEMNTPPAEGKRTVYLRESRFARELFSSLSGHFADSFSTTWWELMQEGGAHHARGCFRN